MAGLSFTRPVVAGESISQTVAFDAAQPATHTLTYSLRTRSGIVSVSAVADGTSWTVTVPAATTARMEPGLLIWQGMATETATGLVESVDSGSVSIVANPTAETYAQRVLAAVRALIEGRVSDGQVTTGLEGLALEHLTPAELLTLEADYSARVESELRAQAVAAGTAMPRRVYTRFARHS